MTRSEEGKANQKDSALSRADLQNRAEITARFERRRSSRWAMVGMLVGLSIILIGVLGYFAGTSTAGC